LNVIIRYTAYDFLLKFYSNYGPSRVVSEIFNVEKYCELEIPVKGYSRYIVYGFLLVFFSNFVPKTHRF